MEIVYLEGVLMENNEVIHFGKSLGFITDRQRELLKSGASKMTRGSVPVVAIKTRGAGKDFAA